MHKHIKKLKFNMYLVSAAVLLAVVFAFWLLSFSFLSITVSPRDAIVTLDNTKVSLNSYGKGKSKVHAGNHQIIIKLDGYVTQIINAKFRRGLTVKRKIELKGMPEMTNLDNTGRFATTTKNNKEILYLGNNGSTIYKAAFESKSEKLEADVQPITNSNLSGIDNIIWSPTKELAIFKKATGTYLFDFKKYDFVNQTENLFGNNIGSIAWSPDNSKIAYYYAPSTGEKSLIFSNLDNTKKERIFNLSDYGINDPIIKFSPDSEWLILIPRNETTSTNKIYLVSVYSRSINELTNDGNKLDAAFSRDSKAVFYSTLVRDQKQYIPVASKINIDGSGKIDFNLNSSIKNICWTSDNSALVARYNSASNEQSILNFDFSHNTKDSFSYDWHTNNNITSFFTISDGKIVIYESADGVKALPLN